MLLSLLRFYQVTGIILGLIILGRVKTWLSSVIAQEEYNKVPILNRSSLKNKTVNLLLEIAAGHCKQIIEF